VFLTSRGEALDHAKLLDFGVSRFMDGDADVTQPNLVVGTPEFMAPEQVTHPDTVDGRADIYALGVLLYEMLCGHCPFVGKDPLWVLDRILHHAPPRLERPLPPALERLIFESLLVKSREQRMQTMPLVIAELDALIATVPPGVPAALASFE
jgi:serine/threonine protein kinase